MQTEKVEDFHIANVSKVANVTNVANVNRKISTTDTIDHNIPTTTQAKPQNFAEDEEKVDENSNMNNIKDNQDQETIMENLNNSERNINIDLYKTFIENIHEVNIEELEKQVNK